MNIRKKTKKMGLLMISTLGLSFINYASSSNGNKSSEIEKLIQQQYSNQNYDLMRIKELYQDLQKKSSVQTEKHRQCHLKKIKMKKYKIKEHWL